MESSSVHAESNKLNFIIVIAVTILIIATAYVYAGNKTEPMGLVSFDVSKFMNAQRAVASEILANKSEDISTITRVSANVETVIAEVAGNAVVLVKQSVVMGNVPDITDTVLEKLGLPIDVPVISMKEKLIEDYAPTKYSKSDLGKNAKKFWDENVKKIRSEQQTIVESVLP